MATVSRRVRSARGPKPFIAEAEKLVSDWERSGLLADAIAEHNAGIPKSGVLAFDSDDAQAFAGFAVDSPVREVCRVLSAIDGKVWKPLTEAEDSTATATDKVREAVRDENGEKVLNPDGSIKRKARKVQYAGVGRTRTDSDENGNPVKSEN